jgi:hypothetical protein
MSQAEDAYWTGRLTDARHGQLDTVRKAATSWSALFTAVLGVFGAVTFASGLPDLGDLGDHRRLLVRCMIGLAALSALAATLLAGSAANSLPRVTNDQSIATFQQTTKETAVRALARLRWALRCGALAAVIVVAGSFLVLFADQPDKPAAVPKLIAIVNGRAYCGTPAAAADGTLSIGGVPLAGATSITVVTACPAG